MRLHLHGDTVDSCNKQDDKSRALFRHEEQCAQIRVLTICVRVLKISLGSRDHLDQAVFINVGRGKCVDEEALLEYAIIPFESSLSTIAEESTPQNPSCNRAPHSFLTPDTRMAA